MNRNTTIFIVTAVAVLGLALAGRGAEAAPKTCDDMNSTVIKNAGLRGDAYFLHYFRHHDGEPDDYRGCGPGRPCTEAWIECKPDTHRAGTKWQIYCRDGRCDIGPTRCWSNDSSACQFTPDLHCSERNTANPNGGF